MKYRNMLLIAIILIGSFLRFYHLLWGDGLFFHPDENNIARAVSQLSPSNNYHPDFFAYGQFPLYLTYFSEIALQSTIGELSDVPKLTIVPFPRAIFWLRFWSAVSGVAIIYLSYLISRELLSKKYSLFSMILISFTPGLIQSSHFGTTESMLTALYLVIILLSIRLVRVGKKKSVSKRILVLLGIAFGLSLGIKLSSVYFILPILASFFYIFRTATNKIKLKLLSLSIFIVSTFVIYFISSPYNIIDFPSFMSSMKYEISVSQGLNVFYTRQFVNTNPYLFQIVKIFPYALGWPLFVISLTSIVFGIFSYFLANKMLPKSESRTAPVFLIILISFFGFFLISGLSFIKWTRFMTPIFPLFSICFIYSLYYIKRSLIKNKILYLFPQFHRIGLVLITILIIVPGLLFFRTYVYHDSRIKASKWIYENIPDNSYILSETGNVVDIPVNPKLFPPFQTLNYTIISFDFYQLDHNRERLYLYPELLDHLENADYIFIPSRRIFANYAELPETFPIVAQYYKALFDGNLGFALEAIITPYNHKAGSEWNGKLIGDENAEETWSVFDHPVIRIYKKIYPKTKDEYDKILRRR